jgi:hypothetical protein
MTGRGGRKRDRGLSEEGVACLPNLAPDCVKTQFLEERDVAWLMDAGARQWDYTTSSGSADWGQ